MSKDLHFLFYSTEISNSSIVLSSSESKHLFKVIRASKGDIVSVTDGRGKIYTSKIESVSDKAILKIEKTTFIEEREPRIILYVGIPEKDNFERMLYSVIPLGVAEIVPLITDFTQKAWWKGWGKQSERFKNIAIVAIKQSHNPYLPLIHKPIKIKEALQNIYGTPLLLDMEGRKFYTDIPVKNNCLSLLIGPPGGFSPRERDNIINMGAVKISISPFRLRTEVAAASSVAIFSAKYI